MHAEQSFSPFPIKAAFPAFIKLALTTLPVFAILVSSVAYAQNVQFRHPNQDAGDWSQGGTVTGPVDLACRGLGAANSDNTVFDFQFALPGDAVVTGITAFIWAVSQDEENVSVQLGSDVSTDPPTLIGDPAILMVPGTAANCASASEVAVGGDLATWGLDGAPPTAATINSTNFGMNFTTIEASTVKVDSVCMEVEYTSEGGPSVQESCFAVGASLALEKTVVNDDGGNALDTDWILEADGPDDNDLSGVEGSEGATGTELPAGDYVLSESGGPTGYTQTGLVCSDGTLNGNTLTLEDGDFALCTFTNDDVAPTLTLIKSVINDDGGDAEPDDFGITVGGTPVTSGASNPYDANTALAIDEAGLAGYSFVSITGDAKCPANLGGTVTLDEGEDVTCTITNDDDEAAPPPPPPPEDVPIPTLSQWLLVFLAALLLGSGLLARRGVFGRK